MVQGRRPGGQTIPAGVVLGAMEAFGPETDLSSEYEPDLARRETLHAPAFPPLSVGAGRAGPQLDAPPGPSGTWAASTCCGANGVTC